MDFHHESLSDERDEFEDKYYALRDELEQYKSKNKAKASEASRKSSLAEGGGGVGGEPPQDSNILISSSSTGGHVKDDPKLLKERCTALELRCRNLTSELDVYRDQFNAALGTAKAAINPSIFRNESLESLIKLQELLGVLIEGKRVRGAAAGEGSGKEKESQVDLKINRPSEESAGKS